MMDASAGFARFQLRPDASERDLKRAYARELKTVDPQAQPEVFQELRESYERLIWWLRQQEAERARESAEAAPQDSVASVLRPVVEQQVALANATASEGTPGTETRQPASGEAVGREILDRLVRHLMSDQVNSRERAADLLAECLDDPHLSSLDTKQFFEWGIASILAGGWRPGHEHLFAPACDAFGWREDPSRLLYLGRAGQIVDAAISEMMAFESQSFGQQNEQHEVIRALRSDARLRGTALLADLPIAEYVTGAFPHWMHVVTKPDMLLAWRRWEKEIPGWRRLLARNRRPARPAATEPQGDNKTWRWGGMLAAMMVISALTRLVGGPSNPQQPVAPPIPPKVSATSALRPLGAEPSALSQLVRPTAAVQPFSAKPATAPSAPILANGPEEFAKARRTAEQLAKSKPSKERCNAAGDLAFEWPLQHIEGKLGRGLDRLLIDCVTTNQGNVPSRVVERAIAQERWRSAKEQPLSRAQLSVELGPKTPTLVEPSKQISSPAMNQPQLETTSLMQAATPPANPLYRLDRSASPFILQTVPPVIAVPKFPADPDSGTPRIKLAPDRDGP